MKMFNKIIPNYGYSEIKAGIGIGCDKDLIIKAGRTGTGINDKIYIGNAIIDACNFASEGNRNGIKPIVMSKLVYEKIINLLKEEDPELEKCIEPKRNYLNGRQTVQFYHCNIISCDFNDWILKGMKD